MYWYMMALHKYAVFTGRAQRKEYWFFYLFTVLITLGLAILDMLIGSFDRVTGVGVLSGLYSLAVLIPNLAVTVRRLHDTNRSGWWFFIVLVPFIGGIVLFIFLVQDSTPGENQYGANPKAAMNTFEA
jgi:uncharacterized membrane protein YhaH (DUF805 family)